MHFDNWIDGFVHFAADLPTKPTFAKWSAISAVSSCLQRRIFTRIVRQEQFANIFVLLVGPPGSGKTVAVRNMRKFVRGREGIKLCPTRITKEGFYEELEAAGQSFIDITTGSQTMDFHHSLTAMIDEFGTFVRKGDTEFQTDLADMYDCPDPFIYKTKSSGTNFANKTWLNLIGGCTQRHVRELFTDEALEFGLPARIIMVFEKDPIHHESLFGERQDIGTDLDDPKGLSGQLKSEVDRMLSLEGQFTWTKNAQAFLSDWYADGLRPYPMDPKLEHYNARRLTHVTKLAIIRAAGNASTLPGEQIITEDDVKWAKKILLETEGAMHGAIEHLGENQYFPAMRGALLITTRLHAASKKPVPEYKIRQFLNKEVPPYLVDQIIDSLVSSQHLRCEGGNTKPDRQFVPVKQSPEQQQ